MQIIIILSLLLATLVSCDTPTRNRYPTVPDFNAGDVTFGGINTSGGDKGDNITPATDTTTGTGNTSGGDTTTTEQGYEHCNLAANNYGGTMGYFGICQHADDDRGFKFKFTIQYTCQGSSSNQSTNCGSCFIPMHMGGDGSSFALGPAQCVRNEAGKVYYGTFQKTRNDSVNSIMVIHRYAVDSFFQCMGAYDQYLSQCYGGASNASCVQNANAYAKQACESFVSTYRNHYKQVSISN